MSDSDDTEVLLLIPPNFFLAASSSSEDSGETFTSTVISTGQKQGGGGPKMTTHSNGPPPYEHYYPPSSVELYQAGKNTDLNYSKDPTKCIHSTPISTFSKTPEISPGFLREIDSFLSENLLEKTSDNSIMDLRNISINNLQQSLTKKSIERHNSQQHDQFIRQSNNVNMQEISGGNDEPLISLSDIWGERKQCNESLSLHEERLRRIHCEKSIQMLQMQLMEYQQKISIAIEVDRSKDEKLMAFKDINYKLSSKVTQLEEENCTLKSTVDRNECISRDLKDALDLSNRLQETNRILETKCQNLTSSSNEIKEIHKQQIRELEVRLSNSIENEKLLQSENIQLRSTLDVERKERNICQATVHNIEEELANLRQQHSHLVEKCRVDGTKLEQYEHDIELHKTKENNFQRDLETQRISLKTFYQKQLEDVVNQKLHEFQQQLDEVEQVLKQESRQRERIIAERAIKQMELISQKSDQEITLLDEKHREEISLYKIQLANSSKTIENLERKLSAYKLRRADITERIHSVMEVQWQKALDILSSPTNCNESKESQIDTPALDMEKLDGVAKFKRNLMDEMHETPSNTANSKANDSNAYSDKVNDYIDTLLKKSPRDLDKLNEILLLLKKDKQHQGKEYYNKLKPPWK